MKRFRLAAVATLLLPFLPLGARQTKGPLPKVVSASVPFYPLLAPTARIQGIVKLRVSTDGKTVSLIEAESGPRMLVRAAKENVKTWQFEPHAPTSFEVKFHYRLLDYECESGCRCRSLEKESVLLQLPAKVEVSATLPMICDPASPTVEGNRTKGKLTTAYSAAQNKPVETSKPLPKVVGASVPFYPPLARETHIDGTVTLRLSTDGKRVSAIDAESGPHLLVNAAKENVKTWEFEPHAPTSFEVKFHYRLLNCRYNSECECESKEKESVLLQLPSTVQVSAFTMMTCDPAVEIPYKH